MKPMDDAFYEIEKELVKKTVFSIISKSPHKNITEKAVRDAISELYKSMNCDVDFDNDIVVR